MGKVILLSLLYITVLRPEGCFAVDQTPLDRCLIEQENLTISSGDGIKQKIRINGFVLSSVPKSEGDLSQITGLKKYDDFKKVYSESKNARQVGVNEETEDHDEINVEASITSSRGRNTEPSGIRTDVTEAREGVLYQMQLNGPKPSPTYTSVIIDNRNIPRIPLHILVKALCLSNQTQTKIYITKSQDIGQTSSRRYYEEDMPITNDTPSYTTVPTLVYFDHDQGGCFVFDEKYKINNVYFTRMEDGTFQVEDKAGKVVMIDESQSNIVSNNSRIRRMAWIKNLLGVTVLNTEEDREHLKDKIKQLRELCLKKH